MTTTVRAGNLLNKLIESSEPFVVRLAVWIAYYPLMRAVAKELDSFERTISKRYEPNKQRPTPENWKPSVMIE